MLHAHKIWSTRLMRARLLRAQPIHVASQVLAWPGIIVLLNSHVAGCIMLRNWHAIGYFLDLNRPLVFLVLTINELFVLLLSRKVGCYGIYVFAKLRRHVVDFDLFCRVDCWDPFILVAFWLIVWSNGRILGVRHIDYSVDRARKIIALCDGNRRRYCLLKWYCTGAYLENMAIVVCCNVQVRTCSLIVTNHSVPAPIFHLLVVVRIRLNFSKNFAFLYFNTQLG